MRASTRTLLEGILDYAGTFSPAALLLADALQNYRRDKAGDAGWMLGRLVVPASSLPRARAARAGAASERRRTALGPERRARPHSPADALEEVLAFNQRSTTTARIVSVEFPPVDASDIRELMPLVPKAIEAFFEVPSRWRC